MEFALDNGTIVAIMDYALTAACSGAQALMNIVLALVVDNSLAVG